MDQQAWNDEDGVSLMSNENKIVLFACVGHFFTHFYELLFPSLAIPLTIYLGLPLADVLTLSFLMYLLYGLGALPWGFFSDRVGHRISIVIFFVGTGAGAVLTSFAQEPAFIVASLAMIGFFASIYHPAGTALITHGTRKRGMALGINGVAGNLGLVSAPFVAGLFNWLFGWQITYLLIGIVALFWGIILIFVSIDEEPVVPDTKPAPVPGNSSRNNNGRLFIILCVIMTISGLAYRSNSIVLPSYLEFKAQFLFDLFTRFKIGDLQGAKTFSATLLASCIYIISTVGQLAGGRLADKYDLRFMYILFHSLSLPFVIIMAFTGQMWLVIAASLYVFFALGMQPIENSLIAKLTPSKWRSTAFGLKFILTFGVGSLAVYIVGWIKEYWSLSAVYLFVALTIVLLISVIIVLIATSRGMSCRNTD